MSNHLFHLASVMLVTVLGGCAAPGAPPLLNSGTESIPLLPDCLNVEPTAVRRTFITSSYLTTWGSALSEGGAAGLREGLEKNSVGVGALWLSTLSEPVMFGSDRLITRANAVEPYCMVIDAPQDSVFRALERAYEDLEQFGYRIEKSGQPEGLYQTNFKRGEHRAAAWYDRISSATSPLGENRTALYVLREVFISRKGSDYIQGYSVGANETWVMTRVKQLAR